MPNFRVPASILTKISTFIPEGGTQGMIMWLNRPRCRGIKCCKYCLCFYNTIDRGFLYQIFRGTQNEKFYIKLDSSYIIFQGLIFPSTGIFPARFVMSVGTRFPARCPGSGVPDTGFGRISKNSHIWPWKSGCQELWLDPNVELCICPKGGRGE